MPGRRRSPTPGPGSGPGRPAAGPDQPAGLDLRPGDGPRGTERPLPGHHPDRVRIPGRPAVRDRGRGPARLPTRDPQVEPGPRPPTAAVPGRPTPGPR